MLVTGEVDRTTEFETGHPLFEAYRDGHWQPDPLILDDQALVANVRGRGLVVLTGCGHSGIVNILRYVRKLTGEDRIHAVIGGFHLSGPLFEKIIAPTARRSASSRPTVLLALHGLARDPRDRRRVPRRVHPEQRRDPLRVHLLLASLGRMIGLTATGA